MLATKVCALLGNIDILGLNFGFSNNFINTTFYKQKVIFLNFFNSRILRFKVYSIMYM